MINALVKRIVEMHQSSVGQIAGVRRVIARVSALSNALTQMYARSDGVVKAVTETVTILGKTVHSLHTASLVSGIPTILEAGSTESRSAISSLESLRVFVSRRFTSVAPRIINRLRDELGRLCIPSYEDVAAIPSTPLVVQPSTLETMEVIEDHISRISEVGRRTHETASAMKARVAIDHEGRLTVPVSISASPIVKTIRSKYLVDVSKARRIPRLVTERIAEEVGNVLEILRVPGSRGMATFRAAQAVEIVQSGRRVLSLLAKKSVRAIKWSVKPVAEVTKVPSLGVVDALREYQAAEAMNMVKDFFGTVSIVGGQFPSVVEEKRPKLLAEAPPVSKYFATGTTLRRVSELGATSDLVEGGQEKISIAGPVVARPPPFVEIAKAASEHVAAALEMGRAFDGLGVASRSVMTYGVGVEKAIEGTLGGAMAVTSYVPLERYAVERVLLKGPLSVPTAKIQEIIPILRSVSTQARAERPKPIQHAFNITIEDRSVDRGFGSRSAEVNLRELGRRIARILREEARRYGINL